MLLALYSIIT